MTIHILLADDHQQYRRNLRASLDAAADLQVVAEAQDGAAVLQQVRDRMPDLVLMDVVLPVLSGIEATRHIIANFPGVKVLALSLHVDRQFVAAILNAGASGYVLKENGIQELVRAIRMVAAGGTYLSPELSGYGLDKK
jgi:DNA-binding NarL/FixJ family response regulator